MGNPHYPRSHYTIYVTRSPNIRQVLEALEFARREVFRTGSPDFLRARVGEDRVQRLCERLIRGDTQKPETDNPKPTSIRVHPR